MNSCCKVGANTVKSVSNIEGGNSDDDEQEDDLPELYMHKKLQSEYDRVALNKEDWQGMINRACLRDLRANTDKNETRSPGEDDGGVVNDIQSSTQGSRMGAAVRKHDEVASIQR